VAQFTGWSALRKFKKIFVEITNCCNLSCNFCHRSQRPPAFITTAAFAETLQSIDGWTDHVALHLLGEPLLHPELPQLLNNCHQQRLQVNLTTNATLLASVRKVLLSSPALRQINFSLHSYDVKAADGKFDAYLDEILDFVDEARRILPLFLSLRLWNLSEKACSDGNRQIRQRLESFFGLDLPSALTPGQGFRLAPRVFLSQEEAFNWPHAQVLDLGERGTCRALRDHIGIHVDGTVVPCCLDAEGDIPLGNIRTSSLAAILASSRVTSIRQGFACRKLVEPLCRRCTYRQRFLPLAI
jgi:radical SAM protein with 4Fe4S-binding SPASM domain